jgi:hypothetical protein
LAWKIGRDGRIRIEDPWMGSTGTYRLSAELRNVVLNKEIKKPRRGS